MASMDHVLLFLVFLAACMIYQATATPMWELDDLSYPLGFTDTHQAPRIEDLFLPNKISDNQYSDQEILLNQDSTAICNLEGKNRINYLPETRDHGISTSSSAMQTSMTSEQWDQLAECIPWIHPEEASELNYHPSHITSNGIYPLPGSLDAPSIGQASTKFGVEAIMKFLENSRSLSDEDDDPDLAGSVEDTMSPRKRRRIENSLTVNDIIGLASSNLSIPPKISTPMKGVSHTFDFGNEMDIAQTSIQNADWAGIIPVSQSSSRQNIEPSLICDDQQKIHGTNPIYGGKNLESNRDKEINYQNHTGNGNAWEVLSSGTLIDRDLIIPRQGWNNGLSSENLDRTTVLPSIETQAISKPTKIVVKEPVDILKFDKTVFSAGKSVLQKDRLRVESILMYIDSVEPKTDTLQITASKPEDVPKVFSDVVYKKMRALVVQEKQQRMLESFYPVLEEEEERQKEQERVGIGKTKSQNARAWMSYGRTDPLSES
ncbi:uncharacterized protein PGTG_14764 [Puccinia graminis f. sp. tritici CRL 75-36-700-3]|uniref:Uncharacterized protein n=1 Tax=Puccinia graminis f. sp. tritici (strain CRL 75-36-700-3 / race SCCL) TaxID=418459 RepID=E3KW84_PUCGT|nr:uncharacterized protein PGTG_14764 [Puccinia graminis f. sp. tritici CRL 75-36-700-3]EFP88559.1 hypothetical protein PGTG_14764 [Puccinia graminis f. sp. tritici CRL 75-36-700-3]